MPLPGTSEYWSRRRSRLTALLNLTQHLVDVGGGKVVLHGASNGRQLGCRIANRLLFARFTKRSSDPLANGQLFTFGQSLDVRHFVVRQQDLKSLTHTVSITHSMPERSCQGAGACRNMGSTFQRNSAITLVKTNTCHTTLWYSRCIRRGMKLRIPILLAIAVIAFAQDPAPLKLTLRDAVQLALKQNPRVILANLGVAQSEQDRKIARSALLPQVAGHASETVNRLNLESAIGFSFPGFPQHVGPYRYEQFGANFNAPVLDLTLWHRYRASQSGHRQLARAGDHGSRGERDAGGVAISRQPARRGRRGGGAVARRSGAGYLRPGGRPAEEWRRYGHRYATFQCATSE